MRTARVVVVDHHDSYTWNLVHLVAAVTGTLPEVVEHDEVDPSSLLGKGFSHIVLSPGPGTPDDPGDFAAGRELLPRSEVPVLGVCLGMQGLASVYRGARGRGAAGGGRGGGGARARGGVALVAHAGGGVFSGLPSPFKAVRYHSL